MHFWAFDFYKKERLLIFRQLDLLFGKLIFSVLDSKYLANKFVILPYFTFLLQFLAL